MSIENTRTYKQGRAWELEATKLIKALGIQVADNASNFKDPDLLLRYKKGMLYVEAKCFNHSAYDVHKVMVKQYCFYQRREVEDLLPHPTVFFYWHPQGLHEIYNSTDAIAHSITNFKNPQWWEQKDEYLYHFERGTGISYKKFFAEWKANVDKGIL